MKKFFEVTLQRTFLVHAEDAETAVDIAELHGRDEIPSADVEELSERVVRMHLDDIPYGTDDDRTVGEIIEEQNTERAAEEEAARIEANQLKLF